MPEPYCSIGAKPGEPTPRAHVSSLLTRADELSDAEIHQVQLAVGRKPQIRRLDVPVDDALAVEERDDVEQAARQIERLPLGQRTATLDEVFERLAVDVVHDDALPAGRVHELVAHAGKAGMAQPGEQAQLMLRLTLGLRDQSGLDRHPSSRDSQIRGEVDRAHAPAAQHAEHLVAIGEDRAAAEQAEQLRLSASRNTSRRRDCRSYNAGRVETSAALT